MRRNDTGRLSLTQQFASAAIAVTAGVAAAFIADATIVAAAQKIISTPALPFIVNFSALFATTASVAGYIDGSLYNHNREKARMSPWGTRKIAWWNMPYNHP